METVIHLFKKYLRLSFDDKVCRNCAYICLLLFAILHDKQFMLSFIDGEVNDPFDDPLTSDDELFDPTAYESEEEHEQILSSEKQSTACAEVLNPFESP